MALTLTNDILKFRESTSDPWEKLLIQANINFNLIYPVGSIYMSTVNVDPGTIFGGTWEQLKDTFLLGAGDSYTAGDTGGEVEHTLTVDEMPSHRHEIPYQSGSFGSTYARLPLFSGTASGTSKVANEGGGQAHNNMPPYLVVYMWRRLTLSPTIYTPPATVSIGDVACEDIVPVAKGGTGADNAADAIENLGIDVAIGDAITNQEVLLWTNPSPGSYATGTVNVNLSSYRRVRIDFCPFGNPNLINTQEFYIGNSSDGIIGCLSYTSFNTDNVSSAATFLNGVYRKFDVYSGGIVFQNGQMIYAGNVYQNWDSRAVPYRIWGVK